MEVGKGSKFGVSFWVTIFIVEYKKAFGAGEHMQEKEFHDEVEARWFEKAKQRSNHITKLTKRSP